MESSNSFYEFGPYRVDASECVLLCDGQPVSLTPKAFDTLLVLVRKSGHVVTKDELMREVWPESYVEEGNLTQNVFTLRKALGDNHHIETVPRRGYRFSAAVTEASAEEIEQATEKLSPRSRFSQGRGHQAAANFIAVLPFASVSNGANTEYLSDGITESIINLLSQLPQVHVMASSAVFRHKGKEINPQEIGRQLGVRAVLVGWVRSLDERLSINTELVDVGSGRQLWGEQYNREFHDVFEVQEEIATRISESLRIRLTREDQARLLRRYTDNFEAFRAYLKGRYYWGKYTKESLRKAIRCFQQATDLDPGYALAYATLDLTVYAVTAGLTTSWKKSA
jgi:TolB-like protein